MEHYDDEDIVFQILDWRAANNDDAYNVGLFGRTIDGKTIYVDVAEFHPYFYVEIPMNICWNDRQKMAFVSALNDDYRIKKNSRTQYKLLQNDVCIVKKHKFYGFTADKWFHFARLQFYSYEQFNTYRWILENDKGIYINGRMTHFKVYESNIEPHIRFMHERELNACGWVILKKGVFKNIDDDELTQTSCDINITTGYKNVFPFIGKERDIQPFTIAAIDIECVSETGTFPEAKNVNDKIIMIATTFSRYGEMECYYRNVVLIGNCNKVPNADVIMCKNESELLCKWAEVIRKQDPDFITGWNIFGFDESYIYERCNSVLKNLHKVSCLSRIKNEQSPFKEKKLASSALGDNELKYFDIGGRVHFDLMKVVQKDHKLVSYKLDYVSSYFFRELITKFEEIDENTQITTVGTYGIKEGQYTTIIYNDGILDYEHLNGKKFKIIKIEKNTILLEGTFEHESLKELFKNPKYKIYWCQVKDDVKPKEIFSKFNGSDQDRTELAMYNIQDCELCNKLTAKLQVIVDNICMANVCNVPLCYLFMRGQGVKIFSLVAKKCRKEKYLIPVVKKKRPTKEQKDESNYTNIFTNVSKGTNKEKDKGTPDEDNEDGFEGAIVFEPIPGMYLSPIFVLDFASLYPNSMRYRNLSHECIVLDDEFKNLPDYDYTTITYTKNDLHKTEVSCIFAKRKDGKRGIVPEILTDLINERSNTRKKMETEKDPFKRKVLDRMQLAYKVTANSLYGQTGAPTSPIFMKEIAACTTATGREMLKYSKEFIESIFCKLINYALDDKKEYRKLVKKVFKYVSKFDYVPEEDKLKKAFDNCTKDVVSPQHGARCVCSKNIDDTDDIHTQFYAALYNKINEIMKGYHVDMKVIYGDTDSVFVDPTITKDLDDGTKGKLQIDEHALEMSIQLGMLASMVICILLPDTMKQEYEKCLWPFIQISKKRYVGNLYETNTKKFVQKSMGIVLKRRDNAQIVKIVCGGLVDQLLNKRDPTGAIKYTRDTLINIMKNKYPIDKFVITKTLRDEYKNRNSISHAVLADRMAKRDPGNKPMSNDRIPYVFIVTDHEVKLQGERVETPDYVLSNNLKIDYAYYITNQIMKPASQFLELIAKDPKEIESIFNRVIAIDHNCKRGLKPVTTYFP